MDKIAEVASTLSHEDLLEITKSSLKNYISNDQLLSDLPEDIILEEIESLIAVEHGQSITIFVSRDIEESLRVIIPQNATVRNLKKAIARHFELHQRRIQNAVKISWKYIWRTYYLYFDSLCLDDDDAHISDYGVSNKVTLTFKKKRKKTK